MSSVAYSRAKTVKSHSGPVKIVGVKLIGTSLEYVNLEVTLHKLDTGVLAPLCITCDKVVRHSESEEYGYHGLMDMYFYPIMFRAQLFTG